MTGYIYLTTNTINNKIYVGQHICDHFDKYYKGSGKILCSAFTKYGKRLFSTVLIEECSSIEALNDRESYWIEYYNSTNTDIGYNIRSGGNNSLWNEDVKRRMSSSALGKKFSDESRKKMSNSKIGNSNNGGCNASRVWINNGVKSKLINKDDVDSYLNDGYALGRLKSTANYNELYKNRVFIHNDNHEKYVSKNEVDNFLDDGWKIGRLMSVYSKSRGEKISSTKRNSHK